MKKLNKEQRAKKHGCNGVCYSQVGMCPVVDTCEETRKGEFIATITAIAGIILFPLLTVAGIIMFMLI